MFQWNICISLGGIAMCTEPEQNKTDVAENNDIPLDKEKCSTGTSSEKMSEEEKKLRLSGRASEYFMFLDD